MKFLLWIIIIAIVLAIVWKFAKKKPSGGSGSGSTPSGTP